MTQAVLAGILILGLFGIAGVAIGALWRRRPFRVAVWLLTFGGVIAALGIWLVIAQVTHLETYAMLRQWTVVEGVIVDSRVVGQRAFRPEIVYEYRVGESTFRDSTSLDPPSFGGRNSKRDAAEAVASEYPTGRAVQIHYSPQDPAQSRLKITPPWSVYGQLGFGGFLFGAGLFLVTGFFRKPH